jgi:hypothetical protein
LHTNRNRKRNKPRCRVTPEVAALIASGLVDWLREEGAHGNADAVAALLATRDRYEAALREPDKWLLALAYLMEITRTESTWVGGEAVTYTQVKVWADQARAREALADDAAEKLARYEAALRGLHDAVDAEVILKGASAAMHPRLAAAYRVAREALAAAQEGTSANLVGKHICGMRGWDPMRDPPCPACPGAAAQDGTP